MFLTVCSNPDLLSVMYLVNQMINVLKIVAPIALIIAMMISLVKAVIANDENMVAKEKAKIPKKMIAMVLIFFVPTFIQVVMNIVDSSYEYNSCFVGATKENIAQAYLTKADNAVLKAEESLNYLDVEEAKLAINKLKDKEKQANYNERIDVVKETIKKKKEEEEAKKKAEQEQNKNDGSNVSGTGNLSTSGSYSSSGKGIAQPGVAQSREPDPSAAVNYWAGRKVISASNFVYPKDSKTGLPLGAWPKNYGSIPTQLTNYKTYGIFIMPTTPVDGVYNFVYEHNGIDFMTYFGTPIYSPVDGTLMYSEWGHTSNKGGDETAYSVSIRLNKAQTVQGQSVDTIFLTHMSGIRYRCSSISSCNRKVKKGELLGFVGNAAGTSTSIGWAPHLHMTIYPGSNYNSGLTTWKIEAIYGMPKHAKGYKIKAGG